jgi:hypothetical protein
VTVSTEFAQPVVMPVRRLVLWRCDSCRRFIPRGQLYLLSDYRSWCVRHDVFCIPKDHQLSTVFRLPTRKIQYTDQFNWWLTFLEAENSLPLTSQQALVKFIGEQASFPPDWYPRRADLSAPLPVGVA